VGIDKQVKRNSRYAIAIGIGLALFPVHNSWLAKVSAVGGETTIFLPAFGAVMWMLATLFYLRDNWHEVDWGDRKIYIPLLVIVGAIGLSGITADTWGGKVAPLCMGGTLFSLYLVARKLGKDIFLPLAIGAVIASFGVIISGFIHPGQVTGGFVFEANYDIIVGYVLLSGALFINKDQWILASLALVAMFLAGSPEAVFAVGVLSFFVLLRQDWGKKLVIALVPVAVIAGTWFGLGYGQELYDYTTQTAKSTPILDTSTLPSEQEPATNKVEQGETKKSAIRYREAVIAYEMTHIKPFGGGYNLTEFNKQRNVHNVPLILVQQLGYPGILAGLAWLWVSVWCLVRTKWKYVWVLIFALSVFDHFIWTQLAPWWWAIIGVTTASTIKTDLIFKGRNRAETRVEYMSRKLKEGE